MMADKESPIRWLVIVVWCVVAVALLGHCSNETDEDSLTLTPPPTAPFDATSVRPVSTSVPVTGRCTVCPLTCNGRCPICKKGKACGDSCIEATDTCHQPPGCACDGP